jgi:hypothetical protein
MAAIKTKEVRNRSYVGKDFDAFRSTLLEYARQYYPDKMNDFSEASMGGLLLDFPASVGDNLSFYLDHQFSELDPETAVETINIERMLKTSRVPITGTSPATVDVYVYVAVPALNGAPRSDCLPIVKAGSIFQSNSGVQFRLLEDVDFSEIVPETGQYVAAVKPGRTSAGVVQTFLMLKTGLCISGFEATETFDLTGFVAFRKLSLSYSNVHEIISVYDGLGNKYYEVSSLTDDVVYKNLPNPNSDSDYVQDTLAIIPAPYRFVTETSLSDRKMTITLGGGSASTFEDDAIPDPSDFAIPMKYKKTFSRISINPSQLLSTKTLGISAQDTTLTVIYRYGGGLSHNVEPNTIQTINSLITVFPHNPPASLARNVRDSIEVNNAELAKGGDDAPTIDTLKSLIPSSRNSQERIVTRSDLLARIYTMPSNFGRVFRAAIVPNLNNPLAIQLHVCSRDRNQRLVTSPDTLKLNLKKYLNPYRMISDSIDILDIKVINLQIKFEVFVDPSLTKSLVLQSCIDTLTSYFDIKNWQVDQPIIETSVSGLLSKVPGIISVNYVWYIPRQNVYENLEYSNVQYDVESNRNKGFIMTPQSGGSIFEIRYPNNDIIGKAI